MDVSKAALRDEVLARLAGLPGLRSKGMFGGYGLWAEDGLFFGIVDDGHLYLRVDADTRRRYEQRGGTGFDWSGGREPPSETYFAVPDDVYADPATLLAWAEDAVDAARAAKRR
jgi:TfoX/Sxy family transcriptional regulator of competence genes